MSRHPNVVVMTRAPRPGQTKTRLQPLLGGAGWARLQHALITHTAATAASATPRSVHFAVDPPDALAEVADITGAATGVFAQEGEHLGARMGAARLLEHGLDTPEDARALAADDTVPAAVRSILSEFALAAAAQSVERPPRQSRVPA